MATGGQEDIPEEVASGSEVETTITGHDGIGSLVEEQSPGDGHNSNVRDNRPKQQPAINRDYSKVKTRYIASIPVNSSREKTCRITGSVLLSPDKLVLVDEAHCRVKVVDTKTNDILSNYEFPNYIWGICKAYDTSIAVTFYTEQKLVFLTVNTEGNIYLLKSMWVKGKCVGVALTDEKIVVTYIDPGKLKIMNERGTVLQIITDPKIVNYPRCVTASPDRKSVFVSDLRNNTVTCVGLDGTIIASYKDSELQGPEQTAIDTNGMIYVGGFHSKNVHLVTPDCKKVKVILDESDGLKNVHAVSYCEQTDMLYIGMCDYDFIKVFQLSFT